MSAQDCPLFDSCAAPLCPMDAQSLSAGIWYTDEAICKNEAFSQLAWIKSQKRLAKKVKDATIYYTVKLLKNQKSLEQKGEMKNGTRNSKGSANYRHRIC